VLAFEGSYHGLGYGALNVTHREHFKNPFRTQLREFTDFVPFPKSLEDLPNLKQQIIRLLKKTQIGAILVEPVQARGGINVPPRGFLQMLRTICDETKTLLVLDEIYTGFGRTGEWFACEHEKVVPDLICLGKALTGGFPLSVCIGKADLMDQAWPPSTGEAIHTSTYLGHPVGCRMALAQIEELHTRNLITASRQKGAHLLQLLQQLEPSRKLQISARGLGLIAGIELRDSRGNPASEVSLDIIKRLLHRGFIFLPEGEHANVISWTPPLTIPRSQLDGSVQALQEELP
jgi:4-aminobutyrate aminotransferase-like enzyme